MNGANDELIFVLDRVIEDSDNVIASYDGVLKVVADRDPPQ
jgi:hypothetical protein